jgi:hypothetical protein
MKMWALILSSAMLFGGGCFGFGSGSFGNSTLAITAVEVFDIVIGALVGGFLAPAVST